MSNEAKYNETIYHQQRVAGKWYTIDEDDMGNNHTIDNWNMATSYETLRWFRRIGSRQRIKVRVNSKGKYIRDIYSYSPNDNNYRNLIRFTEL